MEENKNNVSIEVRQTWSEKIKEKWNKTKAYAKEHKKEIIGGTIAAIGCVAGGFLLGKSYLNSEHKSTGLDLFPDPDDLPVIDDPAPFEISDSDVSIDI